MKALLLLLFFPVVAFSQQIPKETIESLAGKQLQEAAALHYAGLLTMAGGAAIAGGSIYMLQKSKSNADYKFLAGVGSIMIVVGFSINISSFSKINQAGKTLQKH